MTLWKPFSFEKWYFDVTLPTGDIIFFFLARTRILGLRDDRLSLTLVSPGAPPLHRSLDLRAGGAPSSLMVPPIGPGPRTEPPGAEREIRVRASGKDLALDLTFARPPDEHPVMAALRIPLGRRGILWQPVQSRSDVRGSIRVGEKAFAADGCWGYIDRLVSDVFPPLTPVRTLYWGRLHHSEGSFVYAVIPEPRPRALLTWSSRRSSLAFDAADVMVKETAKSSLLGLRYPRSYVLMAGKDSSGVRLEVENVSPAVESAFVGTEKANRLDGKAVSALARNPRGIKFFSQGRLLVRDRGRTTEIGPAPFFSEYVRFG